jgi:acetyl esterase/lipase
VAADRVGRDPDAAGAARVDRRADLPPAILIINGFGRLLDVGHAYARKPAAAGNDLTYLHSPHLTHGFPQFTRSSAACGRSRLLAGRAGFGRVDGRGEAGFGDHLQALVGEGDLADHVVRETLGPRRPREDGYRAS